MPTLPIQPSSPITVPACELCTAPGGIGLWHDDDWRVVRVDDAAFPAYYRVVCQRHVGEFSDLPGADRARCMELVCTVERALRETLQPTKVNIASLGNMTPHLHWHVIGRFDWDSHFPLPVWAAPQRTVEPPARHRLPASLQQLDRQLLQALRAV